MVWGLVDISRDIAVQHFWDGFCKYGIFKVSLLPFPATPQSC